MTVVAQLKSEIALIARSMAQALAVKIEVSTESLCVILSQEKKHSRQTDSLCLV